MRGTRWQRYCFFCREFWQNRLAATDPPLQPGQTRIPEEPDQSAFLDRWFEYHRGYRLDKDEEGKEIRVPVSCEIPWRDTDPGTLPILNEAQRMMATRTFQKDATPTEDVSLEAALDDLLLETEEENETSGGSENIANSPFNSRNLDLLSNGNSTDHSNEARLSLVSIVQEAQVIVEEAAHRSVEARSWKERAALEFSNAEAAVRECDGERRQAYRLCRQAEDALRAFEQRGDAQSRAIQRNVRVFGSREEIESQGASYESPLTTLFTSAYERYRVAEEVRAEQRASEENTARFDDYVRDLARPLVLRGDESLQQPHGLDVTEQRSMTLDDVLDKRPSPVLDEDMNVKLRCEICLQQKADTAVLPCGHLVMCVFCADIWMPTSEHDHTRPAGKAKCPRCRKQVKQRVRIYVA